MYMLAINHAVADYSKWKAAYDQFPPTVTGAAFARVNVSVDNPNLVTVVAGFSDMDTLNGFLHHPDLKSKMIEAGVEGEPRIEIYEEVEALHA